jgi:cystathionine beta-lyase/cystathionine gamma-synthase
MPWKFLKGLLVMATGNATGTFTSSFTASSQGGSGSGLADDGHWLAQQGLASRALHGGQLDRSAGAALGGSIVQSTSFRQTGVGPEHTSPHAYSRCSNPTVDDLEAALGALERALPAVSFGTGLAAETALFLGVLSAGDHLVIGDCIYGGTTRLVQQILAPLGITATFVNTQDLEAVSRAITPATKLVFVETPANPTLVLTDIAAIGEICKQRGVLLAVDNTFLTPAILQPLDLGADVCVYSTTKHIEGHGSALGGALVCRDEKLLARLKFIRKSTGAIQSPLNAYLTLRGVRTLPIRIAAHSRAALQVAQWLEKHEAIAKVNYPGLASFPQRALAERLHRPASGAWNNGERLHGGVLSFELKGGVPAALKLLGRVRLCTLAEHVGSIESILTHSATMTHADVPAEQRRRSGIGDGLVRLSVGLEEPSDIIADLASALEGLVGESPSRAEETRVEEPAVEERGGLGSAGTLVAAR